MEGRRGDPRTKAVSCDICKKPRFVLSVKKVYGRISSIAWYARYTLSRLISAHHRGHKFNPSHIGQNLPLAVTFGVWTIPAKTSQE